MTEGIEYVTIAKTDDDKFIRSDEVIKNKGKMTEEIIVDGVNVAGCKDFLEPVGCDNTDTLSMTCSRNNNCYYKQLQRLKQENELLKKSNFTLREQTINYSAVKENDYRKALEEIREIADIIYNTNCNYVAEAHKILNKINEVLE